MWASAGSSDGRYLLKLIGYEVVTQPHLHRLSRTLYEMAGPQSPARSDNRGGSDRAAPARLLPARRRFPDF